MPLDQSFVGRVFPPTAPYEVGREKIREFAEAIGDDNPVYRDRAAAQALGYSDVIAPPTFPIVVTMRASALVIGHPDLGLDYSRVVHGEQRFSYVRPVQAGQLDARATVTGFPHDPQAGFLAEHHGHALADQRLVVHEKDRRLIHQLPLPAAAG